MRTKGLAPLAARPDQQHIVLLSLRSFSFAFQPLQRKRIAPAILSTLKSLRVFAIKKTRTAKKTVRVFWCGRRDLNPHGLPQEPETCASANFATSAYWDSQMTVFFSSPEEASKRKIFPPADILLTGSPLCISRAALFSSPQAHHLLYRTMSSKSSILSS